MFTVEQLNELGIDIDDVRDSIIENVSTRIIESIQKTVVDEVAKKATSVVEAQVNDWIKGALERPIQPLDRWGEASGDKTTIHNLIERRAQDFMTEKVDSNGKAGDNYNRDTPRYLWAARQVAQEAMDKDLRPHLDAVIKEMKTQVSGGITKAVADILSRNFK